MSLHTINAQRSGRWWVLQSVEAPGAIAQVRRLEQAEEIIEAIAFVTGEPVESIEIRMEIVIPNEVQEVLEEAERLRELARTAQHAAAEEIRKAARAMSEDLHLTVREIGTLLGVSYQRAHQLLRG